MSWNSSRTMGPGSYTSNASSTSTAIPTPASSDTYSRRSSNAQPAPLAVPPGPLFPTPLSVTSWRTPYPVIGQFASSDNEIVAAGSHGLIYFKRATDHASKPWSEPQTFPNIPGVTLDNYSVSGLSLFSDKQAKFLHVYCVSGSKLYAFYRSEEALSFSSNPSPPLLNLQVSGTPAVARFKTSYNSVDAWCLVVPCQSGGLLFTSTESRSTSYGGRQEPSSRVWGTAEHVAQDLGIISAVSIAATHTEEGSYNSDLKINLIGVMIANGRLHVAEGPYVKETSNGFSYGPAKSASKWEIKTSASIQHPGEVTGTPALISHQQNRYSPWQLDLLVPSAEGGIFHFVRTRDSRDEWHMIGRIVFPQGLPLAACLTFARDDSRGFKEFCALIQSGGRLFQTRAYETEVTPWSISLLKQIIGPGPFVD